MQRIDFMKVNREDFKLGIDYALDFLFGHLPVYATERMRDVMLAIVTEMECDGSVTCENHA